jgi:hypothetical protein
MSQGSYTGGCLCGAVRYQVAGAVTHLCYCHCDSCRRAAGAPMVPWGTFARAGFRITRGVLTEYRSSAAVTRGFCAACGSSLTYQHGARGAEIDVTLATLDEAAQFVPQMHVWVADKLPWVLIGDAHPQFPGTAAGPP